MNTTISISKKTRDILQDFGKKSETYDDVIMRMHNQLKLHDVIKEYVDENNYCDLDDAIEWAKLKMKAEKKKQK
jgi:hypothetical protein